MKIRQNKKGITPIIAVILLLMMTIAIGGLAYVWIQRLSSSVQSGTENTSTQFIGSSKVKLVVDGYNTSCGGASGAGWSAIARVYYRNAGTEPAKNVRIYVDDSLRTEADVINGNSTLNPGVSTWAQLGNETCSNWINKSRVVTVSSDEASASRTFNFICSNAKC